MNIAFDLDEVLVNLRKAEIQMWKNEGLKHKYAKDWNMTNHPKEMRNKFFEMIKNSDIMCNLEIFNGAKECIKWLLSNNHKIIIITARVNEIKNNTIEFVKKNFDVPCFVTGFNESKIEIMKINDIDIWVDDCPNELDNIEIAGIKCIMISNKTTPYNFYKKNTMFYLENIQDVFNFFQRWL